MPRRACVSTVDLELLVPVRDRDASAASIVRRCRSSIGRTVGQALVVGGEQVAQKHDRSVTRDRAK